MTFAHVHERGHGYGSARAHSQAKHLYDLGVRAVALNPFGFVRSLGSTEVHWGGDGSLTDDDLLAELDDLASMGIAVMMKPHLWCWDYEAGKGNMDLAPADWDAWFASYTRYVTHYAALAAKGGAATLCVGLECALASQNNPGAWAKVAAACREVYGGSLTYAANWYQEFERFTDWAAFDLVGVNAYFPLAGTTEAELTASWGPVLDRIDAIRQGKPVIFPEVGYRAVAGTAAKPWDASGPADEDAQATAYSACLRALAARPWMRGTYWWKWFTDLPGEDDGFPPAGRKAEQVLGQWYAA